MNVCVPYHVPRRVLKFPRNGQTKNVAVGVASDSWRKLFKEEWVLKRMMGDFVQWSLDTCRITAGGFIVQLSFAVCALKKSTAFQSKCWILNIYGE